MPGGAAVVEPTLDTGRPEPVARPPSPAAGGKHRFTVAVLVALVVVGVPYLWVLWDLWTGKVDPLRPFSPDNFYDLQGRALLAGHLWVPPGSLGIEAFLHDGRQYTYFGLFPSLLRLPVLAVTHSLDGRLTAPSMLLAWVVTGLFASLLAWRLRVMVRGDAGLGLGESVCWGTFVAAVNGSMLYYLAASPRVSHEDLAWSVALTVASAFALLGVVERPSSGRVVASGVLVLCAALDRSPTGYACIVAALLVAGWLALGRAGRDRRRWAWPVAAVGLVPLAVAVAVNEAKFGRAFGFSEADQVWTQVNAHRRIFLATTGGSGFGLHFLPSTLVAYLQPAGLHLQSAFPFVTLPTSPAQAVGAVVLDQTYPTASITASMPLLVLLSLWGLVSAFRRRPARPLVPVRLLLLATAAAAAGVLLFGYIAERYLADFLPFLVLAGAVGLVDLWRRLDRTPRRWPAAATTAGVVVLGAFGVWANLGAAITPSGLWTSTQGSNFVSFQHSVTGGAQRRLVVHGDSLPFFAPAGTLFVVGDCRAMYVSTGWSYATVPGQQVQHETWDPVVAPAGAQHAIAVTFHRTVEPTDPAVVVLRDGASALALVPTGTNRVRLTLLHPGKPSVTWPPASAGSLPVRPGVTYEVVADVDPYLTAITAGWRGIGIEHYLGATGPVTVPAAVPGSASLATVRGLPTASPSSASCSEVSGSAG